MTDSVRASPPPAPCRRAADCWGISATARRQPGSRRTSASMYRFTSCVIRSASVWPSGSWRRSTARYLLALHVPLPVVLQFPDSGGDRTGIGRVGVVVQDVHDMGEALCRAPRAACRASLRSGLLVLPTLTILRFARRRALTPPPRACPGPLGGEMVATLAAARWEVDPGAPVTRRRVWCSSGLRHAETSRCCCERVARRLCLACRFSFTIRPLPDGAGWSRAALSWHGVQAQCPIRVRGCSLSVLPAVMVSRDAFPGVLEAVVEATGRNRTHPAVPPRWQLPQ